jgi:putative ABC transport system ATP-binding protein
LNDAAFEEVPMLAVNARDVTKSYGEGRMAVPVLHGVSLAVEQGEIVALEGPSGSGKTTFLCILGCLLTPSGGHVTIAGKAFDPARPNSAKQIRRSSIGFVFQQYNLFPALTALENVQYALNLRGWRGRRCRREAERVLDAVGLAHRKHFAPRELSGGQRQRVAVARAMAGSAPLILADEPTGNLDSAAGAQVLDLFRALAKSENRALIIVTHDATIRTIADRVVSIRDGRLSAVEN